MGEKQRKRKAAQSARRQRVATVRQPVRTDSDPSEYQRWVQAVMEAARLDIGVRDADWEQIGQACARNHRFVFSSFARPSPDRAPVFARSAVLEQYARWLACERAATVDQAGSVACDGNVVAALAGLPADTFEGNWVQVGQPAFAMYMRCCDHMDKEPDDDPIGWLTDLQIYGRDTFGRCGSMAVDATIDSMLNSEYDLSPINENWEQSAVAVRVAGASQRFDVTYRKADAPLPAVADITDLVTAVVATSAWLDSRPALVG